MEDLKINCKNCTEEISGKFCSNCGLPIQLKRVDHHYVLHEFQHILHFEKGLLFTIRELLLRPGKSVRTFLTDNRNMLFKPVLFLIVTSLIYTIFNNLFRFDDLINHTNQAGVQKDFITEWVQNHYGYANILMGIFIALWLLVFKRKADYNFYETLILLCYVMGVGMLIYAFFAIVQGLTRIQLLTVSQTLGFIYCIWAIGDFYNQRSISSYLKVLVAYVLGFLSFSFVMIVVGIAAVIFMKTR